MRTRRAALLALLLDLVVPRAFATPFVPESVASGYNDLGRFNSLAIDAKGVPHISYYDGQFGRLMYASRSPDGTWTSEIADAGGLDYVGLYSSLELDGSGEPRISYYDSTAADLRYASRSGGTWTVETVDFTNARGEYSSLALDAQGSPHISYYNATNAFLMYASKAGGTWTIETADPDPTNFVGQATSIALDGFGRPHISYIDDTSGAVKYATKRADGTWLRETVESGVTYGNQGTSIAIDPNGAPAIAYQKPGFYTEDLKYASRANGAWAPEVVLLDAHLGIPSLAFDTQGNPHVAQLGVVLSYSVKTGVTWTSEFLATATSSRYPSLALDAQGNPKISHFAYGGDGLRLLDSAVRVVGPAAGATWPVGASRDIAWRGIGPVTVSLSTDGGASFKTLLEDIGSSPVSIRVPHTPTRFARVKVERASPRSTAFSESLFTIQASVSLLALLAAPVPDRPGTAAISWSTDPGPSDLAGYRLEKAAGTTGSGGGWRTIVPLTRETSYTDEAAGMGGARYRLFAVNGFGEELMLGEAALRPLAPLTAWPLPYRGGDLRVGFVTYGAPNGAVGPADISLYDARGRLVRAIVRGAYGPGYHSATWDGRNDGGRPVAAGVYFLRTRSAGQARSIKVTVLR